MALTQSDLDKLDQAIAAGVKRVSYKDRDVTYRSIEEMHKARAHIARVIAGKTGPRTWGAYSRKGV